MLHFTKVFLCIALCNIQTLYAQNLSKEQMLKDFAVFQGIYEQANAGLYKYRSKQEIDSTFEANKAFIKEKTSYREFYNILWNVIDFTGSCHNTLTFPEDLDKTLNKKEIFFPLPLKYLGGKLYANFAYNKISVGNEIISVNGMEAQEFAKKIGRFVSTDGVNQSGKYANIETDWLPFYVYLVLGEQKDFEIEYQHKTAQKLKATLKAVDYTQFYKNFRKRHSKKYEDKLEQEDYNYEYFKDMNAGLLTVRTFGLGNRETKEHKKYAQFLDSVFTNLNQKETPYLIVDVRRNGGGDDPNDLLLYSYLTQRSFRENIEAFTLFNQIPFKEYYIYDDIKELEDELKDEHNILRNGKYYQNYAYNKYWQPNNNAFKGEIILLIDPYVASAASLFASMVKSDENTVLIGEETLGGYYGHTGHIPVDYGLPNSKFTLGFSIVDLKQDVIILEDENFDAGILPDIEVIQSYEDFMNHKDTQLNFAIQYIEKQQKKK